MKRVWTTKKSGSQLADTPAHLWPSESSHHDRPPPPPSVLYLSPRRSTFPWVTPRHLAARSLPNTAHPRWHQTAMRKKRKSGGANHISNEGILSVMKISSLCKRRVLLLLQVGSMQIFVPALRIRSLSLAHGLLPSEQIILSRVLKSVDEFNCFMSNNRL